MAMGKMGRWQWGGERGRDGEGEKKGQQMDMILGGHRL